MKISYICRQFGMSFTLDFLKIELCKKVGKNLIYVSLFVDLVIAISLFSLSQKVIPNFIASQSITMPNHNEQVFGTC